MTEPRGMIADTWHLDRAGFTAGPPENAAEAEALDEIADAVVSGPPPKITSGPVHKWGEGDQQALDEAMRSTGFTTMPAPRLELHERDSRLIAFHTALDSRDDGAGGDHIVERAEAFLAFLTGGDSAG